MSQSHDICENAPNPKMQLISPKLYQSQFLKAMGPPRQATGPPWSGAGVGVGVLRGAGDSLT